jgi:hypothetical protein
VGCAPSTALWLARGLTDRIPNKEFIERDGTTVTEIRIRLPQARDERGLVRH